MAEHDAAVHVVVKTDMGWLAVVGAEPGVCAVLGPVLARDRLAVLLDRRWPDAKAARAGSPAFEVLSDAAGQLADYLAGRRSAFDVRLDLSALTDFQRRVLRACARIEYGCTCSYGELAARAGRPNSARAVGRALGANPVPLLIPCHRVVRADGALGGFSAPDGVAAKQRLLQLETRRRPPR